MVKIEALRVGDASAFSSLATVDIANTVIMAAEMAVDPTFGSQGQRRRAYYEADQYH